MNKQKNPNFVLNIQPIEKNLVAKQEIYVQPLLFFLVLGKYI